MMERPRAVSPSLRDVSTESVCKKHIAKMRFIRWIYGNLALTWLVLIVVVLVLTLILDVDASSTDNTAILAGPSLDHILGTDQFGRDVFSRLALGARYTGVVVGSAIAIAILLGASIGILAGYCRGWIESLVGILADSVLAFPTPVFVMVIVSIRGASLPVLIIGLGVAVAPTFARLAKASTLSVCGQDFVTAAIVLGAKPRRIVVREVIPNVVPGVFAYAFVVMGVLTIVEGSLSYLGFGVPPPAPSWGGMIAEAKDVLAVAPRLLLLPSATLFITVLSLNFLGDRLRDKTNAIEDPVAL